MLLMKGVRKDYGDFCALKELNVEFGHGVYGLLSPNGAGKTTFIKMLATLITPTEGDILYEGKDIFSMGEAYRNVLGYLPQQFGYYKNDSPKQYLHYLAALKGLSKREATQLIPDILEKVALTDVTDKKIKKFSGGMIQRVGIAQALLNDPKILILDEPTAGLDPKERARFRHLLSELARDRLVLISTHIVSDIESIANEIIMIKDKRIHYKNTVDKICESLEGSVYETLICHDELTGFRAKYVIVAEKQERDRFRVRFIHTGVAEPDWSPQVPTLEDVFLYEYRDDVKAGVL
ncbi:ABC transporter ATP-binding protein [Bacillaceae bacterium SIJ1]|uniref:ABC transporter ATP-binding protein n=1 Tax=Litoribacterium kuwaitense TaxID=1398745 RepID=UPI0013EB07A0|nr:ABC transporter ATP-binding protein [Litoribacterium kuwaitense]NGP46410.1 ABC transporter ATP-binding protein [Litoribacterium kuwaitense]